MLWRRRSGAPGYLAMSSGFSSAGRGHGRVWVSDGHVNDLWKAGMSSHRPSLRDFANPQGKGDEPAWLQTLVADVTALLQLPRGWNSYAARPIDVRAANAAVALLAATMQPNTPRPTVVPMSRGDIQLEWHLRGMDVEVVVPAEGPARVWYEDLRAGIEREYTLEGGHEPLREVLRELTARS